MYLTFNITNVFLSPSWPTTNNITITRVSPTIHHASNNTNIYLSYGRTYYLVCVVSEDTGAKAPRDIGRGSCPCRLTHHLVDTPGAEGVTTTQETDPERRDCVREGELHVSKTRRYSSIACPRDCRLGTWQKKSLKSRSGGGINSCG